MVLTQRERSGLDLSSASPSSTASHASSVPCRCALLTHRACALCDKSSSREASESAAENTLRATSSVEETSKEPRNAATQRSRAALSPSSADMDVSINGSLQGTEDLRA
eukprot:scaffold3037_cov230-Pinguiococcus_pyrenoidosus.AAC.7